MQVAAMIASVVGGLWYVLASVNGSIIELANVVVGMTVLWLPIGWAVALLTRDQFDDWLSCLTFSAIASYGLTTAIYFGCALLNLCLPGFDRLFFFLQIVTTFICGGIAWHRGFRYSIAPSRLLAVFGRIDWILVVLLVASSIVTARYKNIFEFDPIREGYLLTSDGDQSFFTSLAYECSRNTPMLQTSYRAGLASRAYHMFPHLTTSLVGRFTLQPDLTRAHLAYEYTFIETFTLLAIFCISRHLTGSRGAGYVAVALMFLGAVPFSPLIPNEYTQAFFYFCIWPQSSSSVEPVLMSSPQMYSGNLLMYGILLAISVVSSRVARGTPAIRLMFVASALAGIMIRFRAQIFLPLLPGMALLSAYYYHKTRKWAYLAPVSLAVVLAVILLLEMRLPLYRPSTSTLKIGNTLLYRDFPFLVSWPGATPLARFLESRFSPDSPTFQWIWQIASLTLFALLNIIGVPLLVAAIAYLLDRRSWSEFGGLSFLIVWLVTGSIAGATCIAASYDTWSVGGQMLLHTSWYLYPLLSPGIWRMGGWIPMWTICKRSTRYAVALSILALVFVWQCVRPLSLPEQDVRKKNVIIQVDEFEAFRYIRSTLPDNAVIMSNQSFGERTAFFSGIGGRRAYLEYFPSQERFLDQGSDTEGFRTQRVIDLWETSTEDEFCKLLPDVVTHVVEIYPAPQQVPPRHCLKLIWSCSNGRIRIWEVIR